MKYASVTACALGLLLSTPLASSGCRRSHRREAAGERAKVIHDAHHHLRQPP